MHVRAFGLAVVDVVVEVGPSSDARVADPGVVVSPSFACAMGEVVPTRLTIVCTASALLAHVAIDCGTSGWALVACMVAVSPILPPYVAGCQKVVEGSVDESLSCPFLRGTGLGKSASVGVVANRTRRPVAELGRLAARWWESIRIRSGASCGERGGKDSALRPGDPM